MKRRLVKHGEATMMISLPAKWLKKFNLNKGDELEVEEDESSLNIKLSGKEIKKEIALNLSTLEESSIRTLISNSYRLGYDKILISFENEDMFKIIKEVVENSLIGFEIIKKDKKSCQIESITEPSQDQFDNILSKIFMNIEELFNIIEDPKKMEEEDFKEIDKKIQQYSNFCRRVIIKRASKTSIIEFSFHSNIIHATREMNHLIRYLEKNKIRLDKSELDFAKDAHNFYKSLQKSYQSKDIKLLEQLHKSEKELIYTKGYKYLEKSKNQVVIYSLMTIIKHFYLSTSPLMGFLISEK